METFTREHGSYRISYDQPADFEKIWNELFIDHSYHFHSEKREPFIIDGGSHIGMSILAFKQRYPNARIIGFEPDPRNIPLLRKNIAQNHLANVTIVEKALYHSNEGAVLYRESLGENPSSWGNSIIFNMYGDAAETQKYPTPTTRLSEYVDGEVDFLKLDIEGCEEMVLRELGDKLELVRQIELEFHGTDTSVNENDLERIMALLEQHKFKVEVEHKDTSQICRAITMSRVHPRFAQLRALNRRWIEQQQHARHEGKPNNGHVERR